MVSNNEVVLTPSDVRIKQLMEKVALPNSTPLYQAFKQLEQELRQELDPTAWGVTNPFLLPAVKLPKVTLESVLDVLRKHLNKGYMPSATGEVTMNSRPQYLSEHGFGRHQDMSNPQWPKFPGTEHVNWYGTVMFGDRPQDEDHIFAYIGTKQMDIMVNLTTEVTIVSIAGGGQKEWFEWTGDQELAIHSFELAECIRLYL